MARRTFFSFHYNGDIKRIGVVRNSWLTKKDREDAGFWDSSDWEEVRKDTDEAIMRWINRQLDNTSVTVVLIGKDTSNRPWVNYEIKKSIERVNGLLGIYIHQIKGLSLEITKKGNNPLNNHLIACTDDKKYRASDIYKTYDWKDDDGYTNLGNWIEAAAKRAGK